MTKSIKKVLTLCIVHKENQVLLGMKKRGFGEGRWNGFGGKVMEGETIEQASRRELVEECGIEAISMEKFGILDFHFVNDPVYLEVHVFKINTYLGKPTETEEMLPEWFYTDAVPYDLMWPDDIYWIPLFIKGQKFKGRFIFDKPSNKEHTSQILEQSLEQVTEV